MRDTIWRWLRHNVADAAIAVLAVATEIEMALSHAEVDIGDVAPLSFFFVLPLLARRRFPVFAPTLALGAIVLAAVLDQKGLEPTVTPFFDALACAVAAGRRLRRCRVARVLLHGSVGRRVRDRDADAADA